ncbi:N-acetylneuraminate synthase family protein [Pelagibius sp.]|uniref:N-acetylneuraminate synthase family protein n=1 Tax=Pelagibius sp. TaxID=1931238 RepID=UPI00262EC9F4|nr:N-acetylneuraminate synthase family protein [Pelagibius sp.]
MIQEGRCYVVAEIGINHNGDIGAAKQLIKAAKDAGCDAVKFQKRTIEVVYTPEELAKPRENPFGETNGDLKRGLEFGKAEYDQIDRLCKELEIEWFASPWDEASVDFLVQYDIPYLKIASASATDKALLHHCAATGKPLLISTGMCDLDLIRQIVAAVKDAGGTIACLYHCTSTYPANAEELNLLGIKTLEQEFPDIPIGYSGHEVGLPTTIMAAALGAKSIERHITLSRAMWGSDQAASIELPGLQRLVRDIRAWEVARGDGRIVIYDSERPIADKLRRKHTL